MSAEHETGAESELGAASEATDDVRAELDIGPAEATQHELATRKQLAHFADTANKRLNTSKYKVQEALDFARQCGEALNGAKKLLAHGEFSAWLEANFSGTARTARNYMLLASKWEIVADLNPDSMAEALVQIKCLKASLVASKLDLAGGAPPETEVENMPATGRGRAQSSDTGTPVSRGEQPGLGVPAQPARTPKDKAVVVIVLLKKHLKAGPTEAVREELRKVQEFCREELSKFGPALDPNPAAPDFNGFF